jgi:aminobenzoyl-glutamate transport protein
LSSRMLDRSLNFIEKVGNLLPHPGTLFALFAIGVIFLSGLMAQFDLVVQHPGTGEEIRPVSLLTVAGLHRILLEMVENFTGFAPLGTVLVAMLGIGLAESTGLISAGLKLLVATAPKRLLTAVIVFSGVLSNMASEIGYVLLVPLAAIIFISVGRHPLAGLAAAFAGVSGGYSANLLLGTIDPLLAGISQEAARIIDPAYTVNAAANFYFMFVSTFLITFLGTWVTERVVEPRLGNYEGPSELGGNEDSMGEISVAERKGLRYSLWATVIFTVVVLAGVIPEGGYLRDLKTGDILHSPFLQGVVAFIFLGSLFVSIAYGFGAGTIKNDGEVMEGMGKAVSTLATYIVLVFFAAQFVAYFGWTNLGLIVAVEGAEALRATGIGGIPLMLAFVILSAIINMFMGSASAKWAIMAPVFIPMFMLLGYSPELVQVVYRIGDSASNIISPMMSYFALIVAFVAKYDKKAGIGTVIALMLPYTLFFTLAWSIMLMLWMWMGIPMGPGAELMLPGY